MDSQIIRNCILLIALPVSAISSFALLGFMKYLCQVLKIHVRKPYIFSELRFRLLTSIGESMLMALIVNTVGLILVIPVVWQKWLWFTILTWILWFTGTFVGKAVGIAVFGKNICGETK